MADCDSSFIFTGPTAANALYVDYLEFRNYVTNFDSSGNLANLYFGPGMKIYYAQLIINGVSWAEKLNGKNGGGLNWVSGLCRRVQLHQHGLSRRHDQPAQPGAGPELRPGFQRQWHPQLPGSGPGVRALAGGLDRRADQSAAASRRALLEQHPRRDQFRVLQAVPDGDQLAAFD